LLAIALDRFWAVTNVDYVHQRNARHIGAMIITVWVISAVISLAPILGWKDSDFNRRIEEEKKCLVSQDISYQIFATVFSFYGPSALVLILYYRIYLVAKKRIRRKSSSAVNRKQGRPNSCPSAPNTYTSSTEMTTMTCNISSSNASSDNGSSSSYQILVSTNTRHLLPPQPYPPVINTTATNTTTNTTSIVPDFISGASTSDYLEVLEVPSIEFQKDSNSSVSVNNNSFDLSNCAIIHINGDPNVHKLRSQPLKRLKMRKKAANEREIVNKRERKAAKTLAIITGNLK
jgi:5-hydroxytryptamine receptor 1